MVTMKMAKTARLRVQADGRLQAEDYARHTPQLDRLARMADVFFPSPIRFFARGDTAQAENWLRRGADRGEA